MAERLAKQVLELDFRRFVHRKRRHLIAQGLHERQQFEQLRRRLVGVVVDAVRAVLAFGLAPEEVRQRPARAVVVAEADGLVTDGGEVVARDFRQVEQAAAVAAGPVLHGGVDVLPLIAPDTLRRAKGVFDRERGRVELNAVLIATGAEAQPIVEALLEHAQGGDLGTRVGILRHGVGRKPFGSAKLAGDAAGRHPGNDGHVDVLLQVAHGSRCHEYRALRRPVQEKDDAVVALGKRLERLGVVGVVEPADLEIDALERLPVPLVVVVVNRQRHRAVSLAHGPWLPGAGRAAPAPCSRSAA